MQVSARVTVTPRNLSLRRTLDSFVAAGFHSVGFSPMLSAPTPRAKCSRGISRLMLGEMIDCGREFERASRAAERYPFANMVNAMREIHRGTHRPYPCGAGAGYLGVSAEGELSACHRFVGDEEGAMGSLDDGVDTARQADWLADAARAPPGTLPVLLGALSLRRRLPSRSDPARPAGLRLHPRLAALLPRGLSAAVGRAE